MSEPSFQSSIPIMNLHHSADPELWNFDSELRLLGLGGIAMTRREAIRVGLVATIGRSAANHLPSRAAPAPAAAASASAKSVIQIWLWGGPCHIDTFDPKPAAGYD